MDDFFDVTDLINDPDFATVFSILRRTEAADDKGRNQVAEQLLSGRGVLQPATPKERERLAEGDQVGEVISVYSIDPILAGDDAGRQSDRIAYLGKIYEVRSVEDWRRGEAGYSKALAVLVRDGN